MSAELTCRWLKMRRFHAQFRPEAALQCIPYSVDFITNIVAFEFPIGTGVKRFTMYQDRYGYPLTTASEASAASYREGLDLILSAWTGAGEALDGAAVLHDLVIRDLDVAFPAGLAI